MSFPTRSALVLAVIVAALGVGRTQIPGAGGDEAQESGNVVPLRAVQDEETGSIAIYREGEDEPIVTQNAGPEHRPFLHPIVAPDGHGLATQSSPAHHPHQTGLYWGFTRVNGEPMDEDTLSQWFYRRDKPKDIARAVGRDYFHNPGGDYWHRESAMVVTESGSEVKWQTVYGMLDAEGNAFMTETQNWTMRAEEDRFILDLEWAGEAHTDVSINEMSYGGLFLRMPWHEDIAGEAVNAARERNAQAEGQRAIWVDVGMQVEGRDDMLHVAIFDHPMNSGFPQTWRVDGQLGVGPARARMGDWHIPEGATEHIRHRLIVYTGELNDLGLTEDWQEYAGTAGGIAFPAAPAAGFVGVFVGAPPHLLFFPDRDGDDMDAAEHLSFIQGGEIVRLPDFTLAT